MRLRWIVIRPGVVGGVSGESSPWCFGGFMWRLDTIGHRVVR